MWSLAGHIFYVSFIAIIKLPRFPLIYQSSNVPTEINRHSTYIHIVL